MKMNISLPIHRLLPLCATILEQIQVPWRRQATPPTDSRLGAWQQTGNLNMNEYITRSNIMKCTSKYMNNIATKLELMQNEK